MLNIAMKHCPKCDTDSIPADNVCLNCYTQWRFVQPYYINKRALLFIAAVLLMLSWTVGIVWFNLPFFVNLVTGS